MSLRIRRIYENKLVLDNFAFGLSVAGIFAAKISNFHLENLSQSGFFLLTEVFASPDWANKYYQKFITLFAYVHLAKFHYFNIYFINFFIVGYTVKYIE